MFGVFRKVGETGNEELRYVFEDGLKAEEFLNGVYKMIPGETHVVKRIIVQVPE